MQRPDSGSLVDAGLVSSSIRVKLVEDQRTLAATKPWNKRAWTWRTSLDNTRTFHPTVERVRERAIGADDFKKLDDWKRTEPEAPDGQWYNDFGSFKICGKGALPLPVLTRDQKAFGTKL